MEHFPAFCNQYTTSSGSHRRDSELLEDYLNEKMVYLFWYAIFLLGLYNTNIHMFSYWNEAIEKSKSKTLKQVFYNLIVYFCI